MGTGKRTPHRIVYARGYGAHGEFKCWQSIKELTKVADAIGDRFDRDGMKLKVNETFLTTSPYLLDALYIVGTQEENTKFERDVLKYFRVAYEHYKPIGVSATGRDFIVTTKKNNLEGVVFAEGNPNFGMDFVEAVAQHRFWDRT